MIWAEDGNAHKDCLAPGNLTGITHPPVDFGVSFQKFRLPFHSRDMNGQRSDAKMKHQEIVYSLAAVILSAGLIAASNPADFGSGRVLLYLYWITRLAIQGTLFLAFRSLLETAGLIGQKPLILTAAAFLLSLVPFVLAVTAFDIVLGFPELGIGAVQSGTASLVREFLLEVGYLSDDHLFLCLLLSLPRLLEWWSPAEISKAPPGVDEATQRAENLSILPMLSPPMEGAIIRMEAQEHYVVVVSTGEQRMVLGRFSDFVSTLPQSFGLQVHRSHWIAANAAQEIFQDKRNMKVRLNNGDVVPVSRRHRDAVTNLLREDNSD